MAKKFIALILFIGFISTINASLASDDQPEDVEPTPVATPSQAAADTNKPELIVSAFDANGNPVVRLDNFDLKNFNIYGPYSFESLPQDIRNQIIQDLPAADQDFLSSSAFNRPSQALNVPFKVADSAFVSLLRRVIRSRATRTVDPVTGQTVNSGSGGGVDIGSDSDSQATGYRISGRLGRDRYTDLSGKTERGYKAGFYFKCKFHQIADCFQPRN